MFRCPEMTVEDGDPFGSRSPGTGVCTCLSFQRLHLYYAKVVMMRRKRLVFVVRMNPCPQCRDKLCFACLFFFQTWWTVEQLTGRDVAHNGWLASVASSCRGKWISGIQPRGNSWNKHRLFCLFASLVNIFWIQTQPVSILFSSNAAFHENGIFPVLILL